MCCRHSTLSLLYDSMFVYVSVAHLRPLSTTLSRGEKSLHGKRTGVISIVSILELYPSLFSHLRYELSFCAQLIIL